MAEHTKSEIFRSDGPLVSILTPSFNQERWLGDNLLSVANQTYAKIEHIVVDGASKDGSVELLLARSAENVHWISEPDRGQAHALNKAFRQCNGEIIGWLNSDDGYADKRAVEWVVSEFNRNPDVDVLYGHSLLINASNTLLLTLWAWPSFAGLLSVLTPFRQPSAFIRRSAIHDEFVDERWNYVMDLDLWQRLSHKSKFARIDHILAYDRHQPERKSLSSALNVEVEQYCTLTSLPRDERKNAFFRKCLTVGARIAGSWDNAVALPNANAAIPIIVPRLPKRIWSQAFCTANMLPFE